MTIKAAAAKVLLDDVLSGASPLGGPTTLHIYKVIPGALPADVGEELPAGVGYSAQTVTFAPVDADGNATLGPIKFGPATGSDWQVEGWVLKLNGVVFMWFDFVLTVPVGTPLTFGDKDIFVAAQ